MRTSIVHDHRRGRNKYMVIGCITMISLLLIWTNVSPLKPLVPMFFSIYCINFWRAGFNLQKCNSIFTKINLLEKSAISLSVIVAFLIEVWNEDDDTVFPNLLDIILQSIIFTVIILLIDVLKLRKNRVESEMAQERSDNNMNVGRGLAMAYFRYIENVIKGDRGSPPHKQALDDYISKEFSYSDNKDWYGEKVFIFFPESETVKGSIREIRERERRCGEDHGLSIEPLKHAYEAAGQKRTSHLDVLKVKDHNKKILHKCNTSCPPLYRRFRSFAQPDSNEIPSSPSSLAPCLEYHERVEKQNNYVVFAENRPLNVLYYMKDEPAIHFTERDFQIQFKLYYEELKRLIDNDVECKKQCEIVHYQDYSDQGTSFSQMIVNKINKMKQEDVQVNGLC